MSEKVMEFGDQTPTTVPVKIAGKKYTLHEAMGDVVIRFRNAQMQSLVMKDNKVAGLSGGAGAEPMLVAHCLSDDETGKFVPLHEVKKFKNATVTALFNKLKEISELAEEDDTPEKLEEQIADLKKRLAALRKDAVGNEPEAAQDGCDSQPTSETATLS